MKEKLAVSPRRTLADLPPPPQMVQAATRIQAVFRGHITRRVSQLMLQKRAGQDLVEEARRKEVEQKERDELEAAQALQAFLRTVEAQREAREAIELRKVAESEKKALESARADARRRKEDEARRRKAEEERLKADADEAEERKRAELERREAERAKRRAQITVSPPKSPASPFSPISPKPWGVSPAEEVRCSPSIQVVCLTDAQALRRLEAKRKYDLVTTVLTSSPKTPSPKHGCVIARCCELRFALTSAGVHPACRVHRPPSLLLSLWRTRPPRPQPCWTRWAAKKIPSTTLRSACRISSQSVSAWRSCWPKSSGARLSGERIKSAEWWAGLRRRCETAGPLTRGCATQMELQAQEEREKTEAAERERKRLEDAKRARKEEALRRKV